MVVEADGFYKKPRCCILHSASGWDEEGRGIWTLVEAFIQELGTLTALEALNLKGEIRCETVNNLRRTIYCSRFAILGMIRLNPAADNDSTALSSTTTDGAIRPPRFLSHLAGLKKLRVSHGSVRTDASKGFGRAE
ncbi:hypothetical protein BGX29_012344, partial [Mortierella sp. GBA35]